MAHETPFGGVVGLNSFAGSILCDELKEYMLTLAID